MVSPHTPVRDIVLSDYRTADIFWKYDIEFCCNGKWPLETACLSRSLRTEEVIRELHQMMLAPATSAKRDFDEWEINFLADYIYNVHHRYLKKTLPVLQIQAIRFIDEHKQKYPELQQLDIILKKLFKEIPPHMQQEEEMIFPYIHQIYHAWHHRESYARLLVRTLRQPVEEIMLSEHEAVIYKLEQMRQLTHHYQAPGNACLTHKVVFAKLNELDNDLVQHIHLETEILFPKAIAMEKELLAQE